MQYMYCALLTFHFQNKFKFIYSILQKKPQHVIICVYTHAHADRTTQLTLN